MKQNKAMLRALEFARNKHEGQTRTDGTPYIEHPIAVTEILEQVTDDENLLIAGLLHDTVEDTDATYEEVVKNFGQDVGNLVLEVTCERSEEKGKTFPRLETRRGVMLKFADRLHNLSTMTDWTEERQAWYINKSKFWKE